MTDIKQVSDWALSIAAEAAGSKLHHYERMSDDNRLAQSIEAHARAIEQHEAYKREVSDAVEGYTSMVGLDPKRYFARFIIAKPDPLVEVISSALREGSPFDEDLSHDYTAEAKVIAAAIRASGLEVRKIGEGE